VGGNPQESTLQNMPMFIEPHRDTVSTEANNTPEFAYLRRCELAGLVPCQGAWRRFGNEEGIVDTQKKWLSDADLVAIVETAVQYASEGYILRTLNLAGNAMTDAGLQRVAKLLAGPPVVCGDLTELCLAGNTSLRLRAAGVLSGFGRALLALPSLGALDLSGVPLGGGRTALGLVEALEHCPLLKKLGLAGCGIGHGDQAECVAISTLLGQHQSGWIGLESADLSGNYFGRAGFAAVGAALRKSRLMRLSFAGNGSAHWPEQGQGPGSAKDGPVRFHPIQVLVECLHCNTSLEMLDLSDCGIGPDTAFVLEDALQSHVNMRTFLLADNPLGDAGLRSVMRLLIAIRDIRSCDVRDHRGSDASVHQVKVRFAQPGGMYRLDLRYPHERATLRTLLRLAGKKRGAHAGGYHSQELVRRFFKFDPKQPKPLIEKDPDNNSWWNVPSQGIFSFTFEPIFSETKEQIMRVSSVKGDDRKSDDRSSTSSHRSAISGGLLGFGSTPTSPSASSTPRQQQQQRRQQQEEPSNSNRESLQTSEVRQIGEAKLALSSGDNETKVARPRSMGSGCGGDPRRRPTIQFSHESDSTEAPGSFSRSRQSFAMGRKRSFFKGRTTSMGIGAINTSPTILDAPKELGALDSDWMELAHLVRSSRIQVSALRYPLIRAMFLSLITQEQQLRFIRACSKDLEFNCPQVSKLCEDRPEIAAHIVCSLFPCISGRSSQLLLLVGLDSTHVPSVSKAVAPFLWFQEGNLSGRYILDLAEPADYAVAENCLLVNAWESEVGRAIERPDVSQRGNYEMLRNESHNEVPFTYTRSWGLPSHGVLRFDYSSIRRPPEAFTAMQEAREVVDYLRSDTISSRSKLCALRAVSVHMYVSPKHFRDLVQCFTEAEDRMDFFCMLHTRVVDPARFLVPDLFSPAAQLFRPQDRVALLNRLGHLHLLNPIHPDGTYFMCNLMMYEERRVVEYLVRLTVEETGSKVIGTDRDGGVAPVPASWADKGVPSDDMPFLGYTYETATLNLQARQNLAEKFCVGVFGSA
jgi:hypothetical protein